MRQKKDNDGEIDCSAGGLNWVTKSEAQRTIARTARRVDSGPAIPGTSRAGYRHLRTKRDVSLHLHSQAERLLQPRFHVCHHSMSPTGWIFVLQSRVRSIRPIRICSARTVAAGSY